MTILPIYSSAINIRWLDPDYIWKSVRVWVYFFDTLCQAVSCFTSCTKLMSWWCGFHCYLTLCAEVLLHLQDSRSIYTESVWPWVEGPKWRWNMNLCHENMRSIKNLGNSANNAYVPKIPPSKVNSFILIINLIPTDVTGTKCQIFFNRSMKGKATFIDLSRRTFKNLILVVLLDKPCIHSFVHKLSNFRRTWEQCCLAPGNSAIVLLLFAHGWTCS